MSQNTRKQDPPFVQMTLGIIFCLCSLLFYFEIVPLENPTRFRWLIEPLNDWFGKWWAVGFCLIIGHAVMFTGLLRFVNGKKRSRE